MAKKNKQLDEHLGLLLQDEESRRENRLQKYPEEADELRPLLKTASDLTRYGKTIRPRPEFAARIGAKLEKASALKYGSRQTALTRVLKAAGHWAISGAIALAMVVFTFTGGFAFAATVSKNTTPGQALYPVKLAAEKLKSVIFSETNPTVPVSLEGTGAGASGITLEGDGADAAAVSGLKGRPVIVEENSYQPPEPESSPDASQASTPDKVDLAPEPPSSALGNSGTGRDGKLDTDGNTHSGKIDAPGQLSPAADDAVAGRDGNPGKALVPGQPPRAPDNVDAGEKGNSVKADSVPEQMLGSPDNSDAGESSRATQAHGDSGKDENSGSDRDDQEHDNSDTGSSGDHGRQRRGSES